MLTKVACLSGVSFGDGAQLSVNGRSYPELCCACFREWLLSVQYLKGEEKEEFSSIGRLETK
jgi:hypothetical protein